MRREDSNLKVRESRAWLRVSRVLQRLGECLGVPIESSRVHQALTDASSQIYGSDDGESILWLIKAGQEVGLRIAPIDLTAADAWAMANEGYPLAHYYEVEGESRWIVLSGGHFRRIEVRTIHSDTVEEKLVQRTELRKALRFAHAGEKKPFFLAQSSRIAGGGHEASQGEHTHGAGHSHHDHHHAHPAPLTRLLAIWKLDKKDIFTLGLFATVIGFLGLATPIAVEALVNTVAFGRYLQPIIVLSVMLFTFLAFSGFLRLLQSLVTEIIQRRMFVRFVGDLAYRLPRAQLTTWDKWYGPELTNRFFDVMTIQKSSAVFLLDGITIVLQTFVGMALLAFYHPFLLGFDVALLSVMGVILFVMGRGGIRTAQKESKIKYGVAHWLQELAAHPTAFKIHGGQQLAIDRANRLTVEYLEARKDHFRVLWRQIFFSMLSYAVASTALLGLGGWLVTQGQLNLGQLVAAELIVTIIVGTFTKLGKQLENYYDLMASVDKLGYLLDVVIDPPGRSFEYGTGPASVRWVGLKAELGESHHKISYPDVELSPGQVLAVTGCSGTGKSILAELLAGLRNSAHGFLEVGGLDAREAARLSDGSMVALAGRPQIFHGTVAENIHLGRPTVTDADVREALQIVGMWEEILRLEDGMETVLLTGGKPLSQGQLDRLMIARAIVGQPRVLVIDAALDSLAPDQRQSLWSKLTTDPMRWSIVVITNEPDLVERSSQVIQLGGDGLGKSGSLDSSQVFA